MQNNEKPLATELPERISDYLTADVNEVWERRDDEAHVAFTSGRETDTDVDGVVDHVTDVDAGGFFHRIVTSG